MYFGFAKERKVETIFEKRFSLSFQVQFLIFTHFYLKILLAEYTYGTQRYQVIYSAKKKNICFQENRFCKRFGVCSFFFYIIKTQKHLLRVCKSHVLNSTTQQALFQPVYSATCAARALTPRSGQLLSCYLELVWTPNDKQ